jgi:hypothetical protein
MPGTIEILALADPSEVQSFPLGRFELFRIGGLQIGRAIYEPGWRWTQHIRPTAGTELCEVEHVGLVLAGRAVARMRDGSEIIMKPGDLFSIPPSHDSWVIGTQRYESLHMLGADRYARLGSTTGQPG